MGDDLDDRSDPGGGRARWWRARWRRHTWRRRRHVTGRQPDRDHDARNRGGRDDRDVARLDRYPRVLMRTTSPSGGASAACRRYRALMLDTRQVEVVVVGAGLA